MEGPSLLRRWSSHNGYRTDGYRTEWEVSVRRDQNPDVAAIIQGLPKDYQVVQHSGQGHEHWATDWLFLPEGVTPEDAGKVVGLLAAWQDNRPDKLLDLLRKIDRAAVRRHSRKLPVGTVVHPHDEARNAVVVHHGRDQGGIYTRVRFEDGEEKDYHRAGLRAVGSAERLK